MAATGTTPLLAKYIIQHGAAYTDVACNNVLLLNDQLLKLDEIQV